MLSFEQKQGQKPVSPSSVKPKFEPPEVVDLEHTSSFAQWTNGSAPVQRTLQTPAKEPEAGLAHRASPNIGLIPVLRPAAKLLINATQDGYEEEANRIADQVMAVPTPCCGNP
jgi:hypothetical protein